MSDDDEEGPTTPMMEMAASILPPKKKKQFTNVPPPMSPMSKDEAATMLAAAKDVQRRALETAATKTMKAAYVNPKAIGYLRCHACGGPGIWLGPPIGDSLTKDTWWSAYKAKGQDWPLSRQKDPDTYVRAQGPAGFEALLGRSQDAQKGGLSGSVGSEQGNKFTGVHMEIQAMQNSFHPEPFVKLADFDHKTREYGNRDGGDFPFPYPFAPLSSRISLKRSFNLALRSR